MPFYDSHRFKNTTIKCRASHEIPQTLGMVALWIKKFFIACDALRHRKSMSNDLERGRCRAVASSRSRVYRVPGHP